MVWCHLKQQEVLLEVILAVLITLFYGLEVIKKSSILPVLFRVDLWGLSSFKNQKLNSSVKSTAGMLIFTSVISKLHPNSSSSLSWSLHFQAWVLLFQTTLSLSLALNSNHNTLMTMWCKDSILRTQKLFNPWILYQYQQACWTHLLSNQDKELVEWKGCWIVLILLKVLL